MKTKTQQRLEAKYGTCDEQEIIRKKTAEPQSRDFVSNKAASFDLSDVDAKRLCAEAGIEYLEGYEKRVILYVMSDESVDRQGDMMKMDGADLTDFKKNAVIMRMHNYMEFPVGYALKVWVDEEAGQLKGLVLFLDDRVDTSGMSERAFRFAKSGVMKAGSIGFRATEVKFPNREEREILGMRDFGVIFMQWSLMEFSVCGVPANANALAEAVSKGMVEAKDLEFLPPEMVPETSIEKDLNMTKEELEAMIQKAIADAQIETKAGRKISRATMGRLKKLYENLTSQANDMKALIDEHEASEEDEEKSAKPSKEMEDMDEDEEDEKGKKPKKKKRKEEDEDEEEDEEMKSLESVNVGLKEVLAGFKAVAK